MKLLFTSVGRRVELLQAFRSAAGRNNFDLELIGADISLTAPALYFCDTKAETPKISDPNYIPFLVSYCSEHKVDALIPTIDTDLLVLAENRERFTRTKVIVSSPESIRICRDKRCTGAFFQKIGLKCPLPVDDYKKYKQGFPAFIKPYCGDATHDESEMLY